MQQQRRFLTRLLVIVLFNACVLAIVWFLWQSPGASAPTMASPGSRGSAVVEIQTRLQELGYDPGEPDGIYGESTAQAVRQFQQDNGLTADGVVGAATLKALGMSNNAGAGDGAAQIYAPMDGPVSGVYREGDRGEAIASIQQALAEAGYYTAVVDGVFGSGTSHALKAFQRNKGLSADGVAGSATLSALGLTGSSGGGGISDTDYQLLARLVSAEARGEPYSGQVAVAAVILNRVQHPSFPDTIPGVAYQPGAFSSMNDGQINQPVSDSALRAAKEALNGSDPSGGAIYFYNPKKTSNQWIRSRPVIKVIGEHTFCT